MMKSFGFVVLTVLASSLAFAQSTLPDAAQLQLAADALDAMGQKYDPAYTERVWRASIGAAQARLHHFSDAQADEFFRMLQPALEGRDQKLFSIKRRSLATAFSIDDLHRIIAFYKTPVGIKLVENERQVAPELSAAQQASAKELFAKTMAAAMAMPDPNTHHDASTPGHSP